MKQVIIIGAGLGGGVCGRTLAEAGLSVLFVEKGPATPRRAENNQDCGYEDPFAREMFGCWPRKVEARVNGTTTIGWGAQGVGVGGTSVFYAAAMEQPERHDFEPVQDMPHPTGGWPVGYDAFRPWFEAAERAYHINGEVDPLAPEGAELLAPIQPLPDSDAALMADLRRAGMHPYRTHTCGALRLLARTDSRSPQDASAPASGACRDVRGGRVRRLVPGIGRGSPRRARRRHHPVPRGPHRRCLAYRARIGRRRYASQAE